MAGDIRSHAEFPVRMNSDKLSRTAQTPGLRPLTPRRANAGAFNERWKQAAACNRPRRTRASVACSSGNARIGATCDSVFGRSARGACPHRRPGRSLQVLLAAVASAREAALSGRPVAISTRCRRAAQRPLCGEDRCPAIPRLPRLRLRRSSRPARAALECAIDDHGAIRSTTGPRPAVSDDRRLRRRLRPRLPRRRGRALYEPQGQLPPHERSFDSQAAERRARRAGLITGALMSVAVVGLPGGVLGCHLHEGRVGNAAR